MFIVFFWQTAFSKNKRGPVSNYEKPANVAQIITPQHIYIYIYVKIGPRFEGFKVTNWSKLEVKNWSKFFIVFPNFSFVGYVQKHK